jgi:DNA-3-methyladenine glycosylase II
MRQCYGMAIAKKGGGADPSFMKRSRVRTITFSIAPLSPFRLDLTAWTLRRRPDNQIDRWDGETYRRLLILDGKPVEVAATQDGPPGSPRLRVSIIGAGINSEVKKPVTSFLERMLGLHADLSGFYNFASQHRKLWLLAERFRGMRPPRFPSVFEALINGIACQQLTLTLGIVLLNRLASLCSPTLDKDGQLVHAFPRPEDLANRDGRALRRLGFSLHKGQTIIESARAICDGQLNLEALADVSDDAAVAFLRERRGVGRWTAEYVLLRGLGRWHVFPGDDVGARNSLVRWLGLGTTPNHGEVHRLLARWRGYGGLLYFHLLLNRLAESGYVS